MNRTDTYPDIWRRFTPGESVVRTLWLIVVVFAAVWALRNPDIPWENIVAFFEAADEFGGYA